jgi:cytochrome c biogenesis protein CcdA
MFWALLSGGILVLFGLTLLFPALWESLPGVRTLSMRSNKLMGSGHQKKSLGGDIMVGAALGPVFSSCSPTYFVILGTVLPASFALGTVYLLAYVAGLAMVLILIALLGEKFLGRIQALSDPNSSFKRWIGALFVLVGVMILFGLDKQFEIFVLDYGWTGVSSLETGLLERVE